MCCQLPHTFLPVLLSSRARVTEGGSVWKLCGVECEMFWMSILNVTKCHQFDYCYIQQKKRDLPGHLLRGRVLRPWGLCLLHCCLSSPRLACGN